MRINEDYLDKVVTADDFDSAADNVDAEKNWEFRISFVPLKDIDMQTAFASVVNRIDHIFGNTIEISAYWTILEEIPNPDRFKIVISFDGKFPTPARAFRFLKSLAPIVFHLPEGVKFLYEHNTYSCNIRQMVNLWFWFKDVSHYFDNKDAHIMNFCGILESMCGAPYEECVDWFVQSVGLAGYATEYMAKRVKLYSDERVQEVDVSALTGLEIHPFEVGRVNQELSNGLMASIRICYFTDLIRCTGKDSQPPLHHIPIDDSDWMRIQKSGKLQTVTVKFPRMMNSGRKLLIRKNHVFACYLGCQNLLQGTGFLFLWIRNKTHETQKGDNMPLEFTNMMSMFSGKKLQQSEIYRPETVVKKVNEDYLDRVTADDIDRPETTDDKIERTFWPFSFSFFNGTHSIIEYSQFVDRLEHISGLCPAFSDYEVSIEQDSGIDVVKLSFEPDIQTSRQGIFRAYQMLMGLSRTYRQMVCPAQSFFEKREDENTAESISMADVREFFRFLNEPLKPGLPYDRKNRHMYYAAEILSWLTHYKIGVSVEYIIDKFRIIEMTAQNIAFYFMTHNDACSSEKRVDVSGLEGQPLDILLFESAGFNNGHYQVSFCTVNQQSLFPAINQHDYTKDQTFNNDKFYQDMKKTLLVHPDGRVKIHHPFMYKAKMKDVNAEHKNFYCFTCYIGHATMSGYREFVYFVLRIFDDQYDSKTDKWASDFIKKLMSYC